MPAPGAPGEAPPQAENPGGADPMRESPPARTINLSAPIDAEVRVPSSKSLTQRALVCAALARGPSTIRRPLEAEDTLLMAAALRTLGAQVGRGADLWIVHGFEDLFATSGATLRLGNAGTAMRFLIPLVALGRGTFTLDGSERMRERPIGDLIAALRGLGVSIRSYREDGCPPVEIIAAGLPGGHVVVRGAISSQFLSGLLLAAPRAGARLTLQIESTMVSRPYVGLTLEVMRRFGAAVEVSPAWTAPSGLPDSPVFTVSATGYEAADYAVEGDASSACWWFAAAAVTGGRIRVNGISPESGQGDLAFLGLLREMGCRVTSGPKGEDWIEVEGSSLRGIEARLTDMPDVAPALGAVALFASTPTRISGAAHLRAKESDRIAGLAAGLGSLGARVEEHRDGVTIHPGPLRPATLDPLSDHRLAMAFAVAGLGIGEVRILDPGCVAKSYPGFFGELDRISRPRR